MEEKEKVDETEEELKKRLKAEIMEELLDEIKKEAKEEVKEELKKEMKQDVDQEKVHQIVEEERKKQASKKSEDEEYTFDHEEALAHAPAPIVKPKIKFDNYNDQGIEDINEINRKDRSLPHQKHEEKKFQLPKSEEEGVSKSTIIILIVSFIVIVFAIFKGTDIYRYFQDRGRSSTYKPTNTNTNSNDQPELEKITLGSQVLTTFTYPIMRNSQYQKATYYEKNNITMSDLSNNDILYNAFLNVPEIFYADYAGKYTNGKYCSDNEHKKTVNAAYIDARINNLYTRDTEYKHATFVVPSTNTKTSYVGTWVYDAKNNQYIYYGNCSGSEKGATLYYDVKSAYQADGLENNTVIEVRYYVAFAQVNVTNKQYTIYSDSAMTSVLTSGTLTSSNYQKELDDLFAAYVSANKDTSRKYKYTFSTANCSYQDYCFAKGEWIE